MESQTLFSILGLLGPYITGVFALLAAIYQERLRNKYFHPKLKIEYQNIKGESVPIPFLNYERQNKVEEKKVIFYHLKVKNIKPSSMVKNCRVYLDGIVYKKDNKDRKINALYPFCWTPSEATNVSVDFWQEHIFDIGFLVENDKYFRLGLRTNYMQEKYLIEKNDPVILTLKVTADNSPDHTQRFEINWDGEWPEDPEKNHLTIKKV